MEVVSKSVSLMYRDVQVGDVFRFNNAVCMRMAFTVACFNEKRTAIDLSTGNSVHVAEHQEVICYPNASIHLDH